MRAARGMSKKEAGQVPIARYRLIYSNWRLEEGGGEGGTGEQMMEFLAMELPRATTTTSKLSSQVLHHTHHTFPHCRTFSGPCRSSLGLSRGPSQGMIFTTPCPSPCTPERIVIGPGPSYWGALSIGSRKYWLVGCEFGKRLQESRIVLGARVPVHKPGGDCRREP